MALNPEEMQKRRKLMAQKRQKKNAALKKYLLKLSAAFGIFLAVVLTIVIIASMPKKEDPKNPKKDKTTVIRLAAAGDLNISDAIVAAGGEGMDYSNLFVDVAHLLSDADISMVNFEGVVCGEPYGDSKSAPLALVNALAETGVDLVQLANSHSVYRGVSGLATTIDNIRAAGMEPVGVFKNQEAYEQSGGFTLCKVKGVKIAVVSFTKGMDGMALPEGREHCVNLLYKDYSSTYEKVNKEGIEEVLSNVEKEEPDLVIAMLHWGSEYNDTLSDSQQEILSLMQKNGVDVILGTHSHYVQKIVHKKGKFVAYSLGDFVSGNQRAGSEYSVILNLEITKNHTTGKTTVTNYTYTPIYTVAEEGKYVRVMRIAETMKAYEGGYINKVEEATYNGMKYALTRIESRLKGE